MAQKVIFAVLAAIFLWSCQDNSASGKQYLTLADKTEVFRVTVETRLPQDDTLSLYYTTDGTTNFATHEAIWRDVKGGGDTIRKIVFSLPPKVKPSELRIDFGTNQQQKEIRLKKITMSYKGKAVELPGTLIFSYFRPDYTKTVSNATRATIRGIVKNGQAQSPSLYPKEGVLSDEIEKLLE